LAVPVRKVGVACERCALQNCPERVAPAEGLESKRKAEAMQKAFEGLLNHLV
jgi:predicted transcriptional regulator